MRHLEPLQAALEAFCRRGVRDPNAVLDVLQESVACAFRDFDLYAEGTNFRAWIFRYVHFEILSWNRRYRRDQCDQLPADAAAEQVWEQALDEPLLEVLLSQPGLILERLDDALVAA
ncbi:MAG: sigma factor, partial [Pirellulales bacterium]